MYETPISLQARKQYEIEIHVADDLHVQDKGKLEYHIPTEYSKERPPINFTKVEHHQTLLAEHPLGTILPRSNGTLQIFGAAKPLREYLGLHNNTRYLEDWLYTDKAQLGLHIATFQDATFVTLTWSHTLFDAIGRRALLDAWVAMLQGQEYDVPDFWGYDNDPLNAFGAPVSERSSISPEDEASVPQDYVLASQLINGVARLRFLFNYVWELIFHPSDTLHILCLPSSYLAHLRAEALNDLATAPPELLTYTAHPTASTPHKPFLSDGDILLAWTARLSTASNPRLRTSSRPLLLINVLGLRSVLSASSSGYQALLPPGKAYIHNCAASIFSLFSSASHVLRQPLGHVAARLRKDLAVQSTRAQVEAAQRLTRQHAQPLVGDGRMAVSSFSNWSKARLFEVDFSSAIVGWDGAFAGVEEEEEEKEQEKRAGRRRGRPVYIQPDWSVGWGLTLRGVGNCVGVDQNGHVWLSVRLRSGFTMHLEREVERLRLLAAAATTTAAEVAGGK